MTFDFGALEREPARTYIGKVLNAEVTDVSAERAAEFARPPEPGVTMQELVMTIKPLSYTLITQTGEDYWTHRMILTNHKGETKNANSSAGKFQRSCRDLGLRDPLAAVGQIVTVERTREKFGEFEGTVTRLTEIHAGYTPTGDEPVVDLRKADGQSVDAAPTMGFSNSSSELWEDLAKALEGIQATDEDAIAAIVRSNPAFRQDDISMYAMQGEIVNELTSRGLAKVADGVVTAAA